MSLVSKDNILSPSFETMEVIYLVFGDFAVNTMASGTNTKVTKEEVLKTYMSPSDETHPRTS